MNRIAVSLEDDKLFIYEIKNNTEARLILAIASFNEFIKRHKEYYLFHNLNEEQTQIHRYIKYFYPESFV
jgi:hypothetical protein